jgi:hypothetical protein
VAFSLQANYTDWATDATGSVVRLLRVQGVAWLAQRIRTAVNFGILDWSRYFLFQVAPQLSSRGWVVTAPDTLIIRKSFSARKRTQNPWICSQELWPQDHRGCLLYHKYVAIFCISNTGLEESDSRNFYRCACVAPHASVAFTALHCLCVTN